jgi:ribosomal protein L40E
MVRVVNVCARCGARPDIHPFRIDRTLAGYELAVCRDCDALPAGQATTLERAAMGVDQADPMDAMRFIEWHVVDPARVRRTAAHFLGLDRYEELLPACRAERAEAKARDAAWRDRYVPTLDDDDDDDDGFIWRGGADE